MKRIKTTFQTLAALLVAAVAMTACSSSDDDAVPSGSPAGSNVYTLTVEATKGDDATTRALSLSDDGKTLNATWTAGDKVEVWAWDARNQTFTTKYGTLTAQGSGISTTLTGTVKNIPSLIGMDLRLRYLSNDYSSQTGTLDYIASHCDYATADVKMTAISGSEISTSAATFQNQQAIIKFTVKNYDGSPLTPSDFTVSDGTSTVTLTDIPDVTYTTNGDGVLYVAFPATGSSATITLTATADSKVYSYTKEDVTFGNGKYYDISVKMVHSLSHAIATDCGMVVCAAGHLHKAKTAVPTGCTAVGILSTVTSTGHGLILALQDAPYQEWNTINSWESETRFANTTLKVLPDDAARGTNLTSYTTLGATTVSNWAVAQKSDYEAIFQNLGSTQHDNDGYTYDANVNAYITTGVDGTELFIDLVDYTYISYWSATADDSYGWFFNSDCWNQAGKSIPYRFRPVLGF